jgi:hypothetical protein
LTPRKQSFRGLGGIKLALIAENHLQFIIEILVLMQVGVMFIFNLIPLSLSLVLFAALILSVGFTALFGIDVGLLFLSSAKEFSVPFGPLAIFSIVTLLGSLPMMKSVGIKVANLRIFVYILIILIAITGSIVHRIFLIQWILGLLIGFFIISKSFRQKSFFSVKKIISVLTVVVISIGLLELLSRILNMSVISPLLRISRLEDNALPNITLVLKSTTLFGHVQGSSYWGALDTGFGSGYFTLPLTLTNWLTLPFPVFYGILVSKKDVIDYFLPGTFGFGFDFGYIALAGLLIWCIAVIVIGFKMLATYREKRENGNRNYLGRETILIGALTAFIAQAIIGLFYQNRAINGSALLTFMFLGTLIVSHILLIKRR